MLKNENFWEYEDHPQNKPNHTSQKEKDICYLNVAKIFSSRSKCASRKIGAVIVKDDNILSWGVNGSPSGIELCQNPNAECPRYEFGYKSGKGLHLCPAQHAERNAILHAAKHGISTDNSTLYCYCGLPCMECMKAIINAGIKRLVFMSKEGTSEIERDDNGDLIQYDNEGHLIQYDDLSIVLVEMSDIEFKSYKETDLGNIVNI